MKKALVLISVSLLFISCKNKPANTLNPDVNQATIEILDIPAFKEAIAAKGVQLIDVRTPEEYADGHIERAMNINYLADDFSKAILKANMDKPVYIYCRSGNRSGKAAEVMKELGFKTIYDLKGGFMAWDSN